MRSCTAPGAPVSGRAPAKTIRVTSGSVEGRHSCFISRCTESGWMLSLGRRRGSRYGPLYRHKQYSRCSGGPEAALGTAPEKERSLRGECNVLEGPHGLDHQVVPPFTVPVPSIPARCPSPDTADLPWLVIKHCYEQVDPSGGPGPGIPSLRPQGQGRRWNDDVDTGGSVPGRAPRASPYIAPEQEPPKARYSGSEEDRPPANRGRRCRVLSMRCL